LILIFILYQLFTKGEPSMLKRFSNFTVLLVLSLVLMIFVTCTDGNKDIEISVSADEADFLTTNSAYVVMRYFAENAKIVQVGVIYSTLPGRLTTNNIISYRGTPTAEFGVVSDVPVASGIFGAGLTGLASDTGYYYKPYIKINQSTNEFPDGYFVPSDFKTFKTLANTMRSITLNPNGGIVSPTSIQASVGSTIAQLTIPVPTRSGFAFDGWYSAATGGTKYPDSYVINSDITLHAQWVASAFTVTLNANGGIVSPASIEVPVGRTIAQLTIPVPTRSGFLFDGWYSAATGGTKYPDSYSINSNITLYAQWSASTFTVTLSGNGGTVTPTTVVAANGSTLGSLSLPTPTRNNYAFIGWFSATSGGIMYTNATIVNSNMTLYAQWTASAFTVTLNANGGTVSPTSIGAANGSTLGSLSLPTPTRSGYTFVGWFSATSGGIMYSNTTVVNSNMTLYAQWTTSSATTYTITLNANGGSVSPTSISTQGGRTLQQIDLPTPTRTGYSFEGWANAATGGTIYPLSYVVNSNITLYAVWSTSQTQEKLVGLWYDYRDWDMNEIEFYNTGKGQDIWYTSAYIDTYEGFEFNWTATATTVTMTVTLVFWNNLDGRGEQTSTAMADINRITSSSSAVAGVMTLGYSLSSDGNTLNIPVWQRIYQRFVGTLHPPATGKSLERGERRYLRERKD
jgi:uncharacterized repeat protein (TIGR02543 family)